MFGTLGEIELSVGSAAPLKRFHDISSRSLLENILNLDATSSDKLLVRASRRYETHSLQTSSETEGPPHVILLPERKLWAARPGLIPRVGQTCRPQRPINFWQVESRYGGYSFLRSDHRPVREQSIS
jgi:hypothetical protein